MSHQQNKLAEEIISDGKIARLIEEALLEDIGIGDVTTDLIVPPNLVGKGEIIVKESGVLAGLSIASLVFENVDASISFKPLCDDGCIIESTMTVATVEGPFAGILKAERTALNFLQRMSGIATLT